MPTAEEYRAEGNPYTPESELDALIHAGLGNVDRGEITPQEHARAMRGEIVRALDPVPQRVKCPDCKGNCVVIFTRRGANERGWLCRKCRKRFVRQFHG